MLRKIFTTCLLAAAVFSVCAQDSTKKSSTKFSAVADIYYKLDFHNTELNNKTSFTNSHNSFELGMVSGKLEHTWKKVNLVADIGIGKRAEEFSYNDEKTRFLIKQLNVSIQVKSWLKLTAGSWATHVGYELVDPNQNKNYSMSYLFSYGPFFHTGLKAEGTIGKHGFMVGVANPTDFKSANGGKKFILGQYSYAATDRIKMYLNFLTRNDNPSNDSRTFQGDFVITAAISDQFSLGGNGSINTEQSGFGANKPPRESWFGWAGYAGFNANKNTSFHYRGEYFNDAKGRNVFANSVGGGHLFAHTFSANIKFDNLMIIPELRLEKASQAIYQTSFGTGLKTSGQFILAAVYQF